MSIGWLPYFIRAIEGFLVFAAILLVAALAVWVASWFIGDDK